MTDGVPNIVGPIAGLVGIGVMAGVANEVIKTVGEQGQFKGKKKKARYVTKSFSEGMDERIRRMI